MGRCNFDPSTVVGAIDPGGKGGAHDATWDGRPEYEPSMTGGERADGAFQTPSNNSKRISQATGRTSN